MDEDSRVIVDDTVVSTDIQNEIKQYQKIKLLGQGAYGKAYLVTSDDAEKIQYVMKVLPQSASAFQEASILQNLKHENIIQYIETFIDHQERLCLIMEYANNGTLGQYIKSRTQPIPEAQIIDWFTQLCLALQCVHSQKILHRDIKAENVFLHDEKVKLGDFGIARSIEQTLAKTFIGTPYYISPEIVQNQPYSYKSDVWSLGVLLYEMCTFKYPFVAESLPALATKIMKGKIQPISAQVYSQNMKNLIQSLLTIDPNKRPTIDQLLCNNIFLSKENSLIQNRIKQLNVQQQQVVKVPVQPMQKRQHQVIIKKEEYSQQKKIQREEQQKFMREDIQKKVDYFCIQKIQQKPQEVVIELFGQPKSKKDPQQSQPQLAEKKQTKKRRDIPVEIYLPFMSKIQAQEQQQQIKESEEIHESPKLQEQFEENRELDLKQEDPNLRPQIKQSVPQETKAAQKPNLKLSFEKAEKLRVTLEQAFGPDQFFEIYNKFKGLREKSSIEEIAKKFGPSYSELVPNINQQVILECLSYLFILIDFDLDQ